MQLQIRIRHTTPGVPSHECAAEQSGQGDALNVHQVVCVNGVRYLRQSGTVDSTKSVGERSLGLKHPGQER